MPEFQKHHENQTLKATISGNNVSSEFQLIIKKAPKWVLRRIMNKISLKNRRKCEEINTCMIRKDTYPKPLSFWGGACFSKKNLYCFKTHYFTFQFQPMFLIKASSSIRNT